MGENKTAKTACKSIFKNGDAPTKEQFTNAYIQMAVQLEKSGSLPFPSKEGQTR